MDLPSAIRQIASDQDLSREQMQSVMTLIMKGDATPAQIGAFLTALTIKGETVDEIVGAATIMRQMSARVESESDPVVDTVGTGGDGAKLFNVSTASALVASCAGARMAKHGNRAATGNSGSADVLETAGVDITITPQQVAQCIDQVGIGFMFAPTHHAATRHAIGPRREIGVRSVFNLLGPLTNPAGASRLLVGVFAQQWVRPMAEVYAQLGADHVVVVYSEDGLDEISIAAMTHVAEYAGGEISEYTLEPEQFGLKKQSLDPLIVEDSQHSLKLIQQALAGEPGAAFDMVSLNAGATIYVAGITDSLYAGVERAVEILKSGQAIERLQQLAAFTSQFNGDQS